MRRGENAIAWSRGHADRPPAGSGLGASDGTWYRMCLQYVRSAFGLPGGTPDAGTAWDQAQRKHRTSDPNTIPRGVPVFWELPSVADHVAISLGDGKCRSTDAVRRGQANVVTIDSITRNWGGTLLGWTEDLNGYTIWEPEPRTPNIAAVLEADTWAEREPALRKVVEHGSPQAQAAAQQWLAAHAARVAARQAAQAAREALKALRR